MTDPWHLPAWAEPYRTAIYIEGGHSVESVVNSGPQHASFDDAVRQVSVLHQIKLLRALMSAGLLLVAVPVRKPSKATKAKRAKRRR